MNEDLTIGGGGDNLFTDLGLPDADARLAKAELSRIIHRVLEDRGLLKPQKLAAEALGITQPDVSDLVRGRVGRFSMERLEQFLTRLGLDVRIQVTEKPASRPHAAVTVERVTA